MSDLKSGVLNEKLREKGGLTEKNWRILWYNDCMTNESK